MALDTQPMETVTVSGGRQFGFLGLLAAGMTESWFNDSEILMCLFFLVGTAWRLSHTPTNEVT